MKIKEIVYPQYILSISRHILVQLAKSISPYVRRYTFGQSYMSRETIIRVTQYMSVYLSMKFSDKVYTHMYWVHACIYFYSWFFVLIERTHTCTYSNVWAHTMWNCFFLPAPGRPGCTLLACLYWRECSVMTLKSLHKSKQLYFSHSAFKRLTIIKKHQNWSCVAGQT